MIYSLICDRSCNQIARLRPDKEIPFYHRKKGKAGTYTNQNYFPVKVEVMIMQVSLIGLLKKGPSKNEIMA